MSAVLKSATGITVKPLHPLFVAEVTGVDLTVPVSRDDFRVIWDAFNQYEVLVVRDQKFEDDTQIAFSRNFGPLETMEAHPANNFKPGHIAVMTNLDAQGNLLPLDDPGMLHRLREAGLMPLARRPYVETHGRYMVMAWFQPRDFGGRDAGALAEALRALGIPAYRCFPEVHRTGMFDAAALRIQARALRPKLITIGGSLNLFVHPVRALRDIADRTSGRFFRGEDDGQVQAAIDAILTAGRPVAGYKAFAVRRDLYLYFFGAAFICMAAGIFL